MSEFQRATRGRILIADDNDDVRSLIAELLEWEGYQVTEAANGKEAIRKTIDQRPDVLILDYRMPGFNGGQVYRALRDAGVNVAVVLITAEGNGKQLAVSLGLRYFLEKPFHLPALLKMIEDASRRR